MAPPNEWCFNTIPEADRDSATFIPSANETCGLYYVDPVQSLPSYESYPADCTAGCRLCEYTLTAGKGYQCKSSALLLRGCPGPSWPPQPPSNPPPSVPPLPLKPNLLYMLADDLGYHDLGVQGCADIPTPSLDSIAANGIRFTNGYVAAPVCSPSRAGILTGRYQNRFGYEHNTPNADLGPEGMPAGVATAVTAFREAGYVTGHIGKWHVGFYFDKASTPETIGFNRSVWYHGQTKLPTLGGHIYHWTPQGGSVISVSATDRYVDEAMAREAVAFMHEFWAVPWFLYIGFLTPHEPLDTPEDAFYPDLSLSRDKRQLVYKAMSLLDISVGKVMAGLRAHNMEEKTIVFFTSDNGAYPGFPNHLNDLPPTGWRGNAGSNTPFRGQKGYLFEGGIRVPFLMQFKGVLPRGTVSHIPVISLDILPTGLAAAGVDISRYDGVNLLPLLRGQTSSLPRKYLHWRYNGGLDRASREQDGHFKLLRSMSNVYDGAVETMLFNVTADPEERQDLSSLFPDKYAEMKAAWDAWEHEMAEPLWGPPWYTGGW